MRKEHYYNKLVEISMSIVPNFGLFSDVIIYNYYKKSEVLKGILSPLILFLSTYINYNNYYSLYSFL